MMPSILMIKKTRPLPESLLLGLESSDSDEDERVLAAGFRCHGDGRVHARMDGVEAPEEGPVGPIEDSDNGGVVVWPTPDISADSKIRNIVRIVVERSRDTG